MLDPDRGGLRPVTTPPRSIGEVIVGDAAVELQAIAEAEAPGMLEDARRVMLEVACELDELVALGGPEVLRGLRDQLRRGVMS